MHPDKNVMSYIHHKDFDMVLILGCFILGFQEENYMAPDNMIHVPRLSDCTIPKVAEEAISVSALGVCTPGSPCFLSPALQMCPRVCCRPHSLI
jgi:hypothetical protein